MMDAAATAFSADSKETIRPSRYFLSNSHSSKHHCRNIRGRRRLRRHKIMRPPFPNLPLLAVFHVLHVYLFAAAIPLPSIGETPFLFQLLSHHCHLLAMSACFAFASPDARRSAWPSRRPRVLQAPPIHPLRMYPFATLRNDFSPESSSCCAITSSPGIASSPSVACFFDAEEEGVMVMER